MGRPIRILGIDPGLRITGFGLIQRTGQRLIYITSGVIRTPDAELPQRLKAILDNLNEVIAQHQPAQVAIEKVFVNVNPQSTLLLGQARGAAICAAVACSAVQPAVAGTAPNTAVAAVMTTMGIDAKAASF